MRKLPLVIAFTFSLFALWIVSGRSECPSSPQLKEPAIFWADIANDGRLENWRRGIAIYSLFERHVRRDAKLKDVATTLANPTWLKDENVSIVWIVAGAIPLKMTPNDTMFRVLVFPNEDANKHNKEHIAIYINVRGSISQEEFLSTIKGMNKDTNDRIVDWAFWPPWNENIERIPKSVRKK